MVRHVGGLLVRVKRLRVVSGGGLGALDHAWEGVEVGSRVVDRLMAGGGWVGGWVEEREESDDLGTKDRRGEDSGIEGILKDEPVVETVGKLDECWMEAV